MNHTTNDYTGGTYVEAGTLNIPIFGGVIPANSDVTVASGATFQFGPTGGDNSGFSLRTVTLNGGTFRIPFRTAIYELNRLVTGPTGGTVDFADADGTAIFLTGAGAGATINGNSNWIGTGTFSGVYNSSGGTADLTIAPNATLTCHTHLNNAFNILGGGTLYMTASANAFFTSVYTVSQGRLRVEDLSVNGTSSVLGLATPGFLTLNGGTLHYSGVTASSPMPITLSAVGGAVEVSNAATVLTLTGVIGPAAGSAAGPLNKTGPGVLILNNLANTYVGGIMVSGGRLDVSDDAQLGGANLTVNAFGTLRYTNDSITARTFTLNAGALEVPIGVTLTLNGATVGGGILRGAGTFAITGGTALSGVTTANSTKVNVTGSGSFVSYSNSGALTVMAGSATPATLDLVINQGSGSITVAAASSVNVSDFQTYGALTLNPATIGSGQFALLTNTGVSPLSFNGGSRTFLGTPATAGPPNNPNFVAGIDLNGQNAVVAGGLFVNNGFVVDSSNGGAGTATVIADFGALVKGAGFFQNPVVTQNGGRLQAGNSPGAAAFGKFIFGPGRVDNYVFAIDDATGTAGPSPDALGHVSGWGLVKAVRQTVGTGTTSGDFVWTATQYAKLTVALDTLINPTTVGTDGLAMMADFDPSRSYSWPAVQWSGTYSGPTDAATLNADTAFDTSGFLNPVAGTFGWSLDSADHSLSLTYTPTPVPEPGTLALVGFGAAALVCRRRRKVARVQVGKAGIRLADQVKKLFPQMTLAAGQSPRSRVKLVSLRFLPSMSKRVKSFEGKRLTGMPSSSSSGRNARRIALGSSSK